jgi:carboxymethylenebutenolidase
MVPEERDGGGETDHLSRRQAIATAVGGTFALAVRPVSAATITTSGEGLDTADVKIPTASGAIPGYRAMPGKKGAKGFPVVLVVQEIFGVHEHIRDVCRRLAKQGYYAIAPELYFRQGDVSKLSEYKDIREIVAKVPDAQVLGDLDAAAAFAKASGAADMGRLAITGFCWGGRIVWLYVTHSAAPRAGVAWYGRLTGDKNALQPQHPLDVAGALHAPVLGLYGAEDQSIPVATVEEMRKALAAGSPAARASEIKVYPGAGHAFHADYRPTYKKEAAEDGWGRLLAWFEAHGVAP